MGGVRRALGLALVAICCAWLAGCYVGPGYVGFGVPVVAVGGPEVVVPEAPPPALGEVVTVAPGPGFIWIGGFWDWGPSGWFWVHGHWGHRPFHGAVWAGPFWEHHEHGWVLRRGHWR